MNKQSVAGIPLVRYALRMFYKSNRTELLHKPRKSRPSRMEPYKPIIKEWLLEDKTRHYKQRHTAKRVFDRLSEMYSDFNLSYATVATTFRKLKSEVYYVSKEYAPIRHLPAKHRWTWDVAVLLKMGISIRDIIS